MSDQKNIHIWVVEDHTIYRKSLVLAINSIDGFQCDDQFDDAESMLDGLKGSSKPDIILLDVQLPGVDGISALDQVQKLAPNVKTVILTAFDDAEKIFQAVCSGASGYILKASVQDEIESILKAVLNGGAPLTPSVAKKVLTFFKEAPPNLKISQDDYQLTNREREILQLMADGLITKTIASELDISKHTVISHIRSIYNKLHVDTNTGAVAKALRERLI